MVLFGRRLFLFRFGDALAVGVEGDDDLARGCNRSYSPVLSGSITPAGPSNSRRSTWKCRSEPVDLWRQEAYGRGRRWLMAVVAFDTLRWPRNPGQGGGVPGGQQPAEACRLGRGRPGDIGKDALLPGADAGVPQQGAGAARGAGVAQRGVPPGRTAGGPAAMPVARFIGVVVGPSGPRGGSGHQYPPSGAAAAARMRVMKGMVSGRDQAPVVRAFWPGPAVTGTRSRPRVSSTTGWRWAGPWGRR